MLYKPRNLESKLLDYSRYFSAVLVTGSRQTGKSTMLSKVFPDVKAIVFDPVQDLYDAKSDPDMFLDNFPPPLILDEVQYVPELLAALKRRIDKNKQPGMYLLTGSQNLSVLRNTAESMAGRVGILHLEGMSLQEMLDKGGEMSWLEKYLKDPVNFLTKADYYSSGRLLYQTLWRGSLPGTLDMPDSIISDYYQSYIQTYIERDVRVAANISDITEFSRFLALLSALTGQEINHSQLGRKIASSPGRSKRWTEILSATFQWMEIEPFFGNTIKRISGKKKGHIRDSGLACYLQRISTPDALSINPQKGNIFESWVVNQIYRLNQTLSLSAREYHWRTNGGAEVDLILERDGSYYPIEVKCKSKLSRHDARGIKAFRETYPQLNIKPGVIIYAGSEVYQVTEGVTAIPWDIV